MHVYIVISITYDMIFLVEVMHYDMTFLERLLMKLHVVLLEFFCLFGLLLFNR